MAEGYCETGKAWGSHKMKRLRFGHNLPRTAEAGSTLHSRAYPGHALKDNKVRYVCARQGENIGLSSHSSQAEGASAENGLAAGSTFGVSRSSTAKMVSKTGTFLPGQSNDFLNNPKEGLSGEASARKLWTRTMWSRAVGSGLARPTPKSDKASRCQLAIWSP